LRLLVTVQSGEDSAGVREGNIDQMVHPQNVQLHNVQLQNVQLPNVQLQNIQDTKRPGYKTSSYQTSSYGTSRIQDVQDTKRPVFVNLKTCFKKTRGRKTDILDAVNALRPARSDVVVKLGARTQHPCVVRSMHDADHSFLRIMGDVDHGCVPTLCRDRSGLVVGTQWAGG
jgi:hypothetical protein